MCRVSKLTLRNIVIHFKVRESRLTDLRGYVRSLPEAIRRRERNFVCIKEAGFSFTIFPHSGNVIGTGIIRSRHVRTALDAFIRLTKLPPKKKSLSVVKVTNCTYTGRVSCDSLDDGDVHVCQLMSLAVEEKVQADKWDISFRSQFFPGIRIRHTDGGTINLFNNGKFILVGVNSSVQAERVRQALCVFMRMCWTTLNAGTSCVWTAES